MMGAECVPFLLTFFTEASADLATCSSVTSVDIDPEAKLTPELASALFFQVAENQSQEISHKELMHKANTFAFELPPLIRQNFLDLIEKYADSMGIE